MSHASDRAEAQAEHRELTPLERAGDDICALAQRFQVMGDAMSGLVVGPIPPQVCLDQAVRVWCHLSARPGADARAAALAEQVSLQTALVRTGWATAPESVDTLCDKFPPAEPRR